MNMTSELGVSFHSDNYARKQNIDGKKEVMKNMNQEKPVEEVFFETCVLQMNKRPSTTTSFMQLQISQQFVHAENLQLPPIPITPLPTNMPQINAYCGQSASQGGNHTHNVFFPNNEPLGSNFHSGFRLHSAQNMAYTKEYGESGDIVSTALNIANMM